MDASAFALLAALPPLPFARLVRPDRAQLKEAFSAFQKDGTLPRFTYSHAQAFPVGAYLAAVEDARERLTDLSLAPALADVYVRKFNELELRAKLIAAVAKQDDPEVTRLSIALYGPQTDTSNSLQQDFIGNLGSAKKGEVFHHTPKITAADFCALAEATLAHYGITTWRVALSPRDRIRISHGKHINPVLRIPKKLHVSKRRAKRLLTHEIEVHALRTDNGQHSQLKLLGVGCAGYIATEEGLAMYFQNQVDGRQEPPGLWDAWSCALMREYGFAKAYDTLKQAETDMLTALGKDPSTAAQFAWRLVCRASRGISHPGEPGIGYFRDHIYRAGFLAVQAHLAHTPSDLPLLFSGNCGLDDLPTLKTLSIAPGRIPELISDKIVNMNLSA